MILKLGTPQKLPKAGPSLRRHKSPGDPTTDLMFPGLLRPARASYLEAVMGSVGAVCTRLTTRDTSLPNQHLVWQGGTGKWLFTFFVVVVPTSKADGGHGSDIMAGVPAAAAIGMAGLKSKKSFMHKSDVVPPLPKAPTVSFPLTNDTLTYRRFS